MCMPKGKTMPEHHVLGEITLLCLQGQVAVTAHGGEQLLGPGQMLYLLGGQAHALAAREVENRDLKYKVEETRARIENLLARLPEGSA